ncbi:MAG: murein biosynthesis integral membrane protein MurJ, partial [Pseudomonadales bacterium]
MEENSKDKGRLLKSSAVVSLMTMISRVFGLARDMVIAYFFGAAAGADAFFLAFRIPNFFRRLFAEGAFSQAFVPVLTEYKTNRTHAEVKDLVSRTAGTLGLVLLGITILGVMGAELVISLFAPGFIYQDEAAKFALAVDMLRLTFPYLLLISLTALSGAILNTYGRFAVPAFTPVLLNLSLISCAVGLYS